MAKYKFWVSTDKIKSEISEIVEIPDEDLEDLDETCKEKVIFEYFDCWKNQNTHGGWKEIK